MAQYSPDSGEGRRLLAHELTHVVQQSSGSPAVQRQPVQPPCGLSEKDLEKRMNEPLPWGYQPEDDERVVAQKRVEMRKTSDYREIMSSPCLPAPVTPIQVGVINTGVFHAEGVSMKEIIDGVMANRPFQVIRKPSGGQQLEGWLDPSPLSGSKQMVVNPRHIVTGPDASTSPGDVNLPAPGGGTAPQCGDTCTAAERKVTEVEFGDMQTPVRSCCDTTQCGKIREGLRIAKDNVNKTLGLLGSREGLDFEMRRNFNTTDEAAYLDVEDGLKRVVADLEFAGHQWFCREQAHADQACAGTVGARALQWRIMVCFDRNGDIAWDSILHEVMHTSGLATGVTEVYRHETQKYPPSRDALHNADSYAAFVVDVSDPTWKESKNLAVGLRAEAGTTLRGGLNPVVGARFEWTPRGAGLRLVDFTVGSTVLWSPTKGVLPGDASIGLIGEAGLRIRPRSAPLIFDLDAGGLLSIGGSPRLDFAPRLSAALQVGGRDSRFLVGVDVRAIYQKAQIDPDQWIVGISVGGTWGRPSRRERLSHR
jgi:hypothetical protein